MGWFGDPVEVASVVLFIASDLSSYRTGNVLEVTGAGTCGSSAGRALGQP